MQWSGPERSAKPTLSSVKRANLSFHEHGLIFLQTQLWEQSVLLFFIARRSPKQQTIAVRLFLYQHRHLLAIRAITPPSTVYRPFYCSCSLTIASFYLQKGTLVALLDTDICPFVFSNQ